MTKLALLLAVSAAVLTACSANGSAADPAPARGGVRSDLYQCEGCEGAQEVNAAQLASSARIAAPGEPGEPMRIEGSVFAADGQTSAPGVVIYAYQTNAAGLYAGGTPETDASRRHGRLRAWIRTDAQGRYSFDTIKPAPYPNDTLPAHIHFTVLEAGKQPYWIDDIVFDGEFGVTAAYRATVTNKGGNGIVKLTRDSNGTWQARRDIVLEPHPN